MTINYSLCIHLIIHHNIVNVLLLILISFIIVFVCYRSFVISSYLVHFVYTRRVPGGMGVCNGASYSMRISGFIF